MIGIDLFAGAGGLSLGAEMAGINVRYAVEKDPFAAKAYEINHPCAQMINSDINDITGKIIKKELKKSIPIILFGGPPCQGYSTSNQKTRNKDNPKNWLFQEFIRLAKEVNPEWVLFENVKGIIETEKGFFREAIKKELEGLGYTCTEFMPSALCFGIPQKRNRFFMIGSKKGLVPKVKDNKGKIITVEEAFADLPLLSNGAAIDVLPYRKAAESKYAKMLRGNLQCCSGHLVSKNSALVLARYPFIPQGGNWSDIPESLMGNYKDKSRCHTGVYKRLKADEPALTVGNYRKSMIIHPWEDRGLSVREAARLQSFPDSYQFYGSIGYQQQQVGNAVPPLLAKAVFSSIIEAQEQYNEMKHK